MDQRIKSPRDLAALRDQARADIDLRTGEKEMRIIVHMGTCGIAAGARDVLNQVIAELEEAAIKNVSVRLSGCLGLCDQEPMLTLTDRAGREYCYGGLDKTKVHEIVSQHVKNDEPVSAYIVRTE
jgi:NADP-reducing hydrogenase subunit HndB